MSRLPRLHSSPDRAHDAAPSMAPSKTAANTVTTRTLKRKPTEEELEATDRATKLPAIGPAGSRANRPLQPSSRTTNLKSSTLGHGPPPLTKPQAPSFASSTSRAPRTARATSAPPKTTATITTRTTATRTATTSRTGAAARAGTTAARAGGLNGKDLQALQERVSSVEEARAADLARLSEDMLAEKAKVMELQENQLLMSRQLAEARTQEMTQRRELDNYSDEIQSLKKRHAQEVDEYEAGLRKKDREMRELREDLRVAQSDLERERETVTSLRATISSQSTAQLTLATQKNVLQAQCDAVQASLDAATATISQLQLDLESSRKRIAELEQDAREAEGVRRKLHNMVQELKGNIRVFCRVRPILPSDLTAPANSRSGSPNGASPSIEDLSPEELDAARKEATASIAYPDRRDHKEIVLSSSSESATGQERKEVWNFSFDRVFEPDSTQAEVFEEVSQLAQSCVDGYNVCIFAYGQTGSGKSFTMEGGPTESTAGMIPRAVEQVFSVAEELKSKGWEYKMEGQFLEIYNETINDLLGKDEFDKKKHEIKHDKSGTRVTDIVTIPLRSATQVRSLLAIAQSRRTVAATLMNERSSRSHSVFTLKIQGNNTHTGETCDGSLNLVDLAGSERLKESGAANDKDRLKETQSINKSLSALGDVIAALGEKGEKGEKHIPYRNSKLTYLLQNSLSGNSKTLMILNVSPLAVHLGESLCSLRFATKVNNTTIGTAKKQTRSAS